MQRRHPVGVGRKAWRAGRDGGGKRQWPGVSGVPGDEGGGAVQHRRDDAHGCRDQNVISRMNDRRAREPGEVRRGRRIAVSGSRSVCNLACGFEEVVAFFV